MIRCPTCGRRLATERRVCPIHGAPALAPPAPERDGEDDAALAALVHELGYAWTGTLGRGGFGAVVSARRAGETREVAIKLVYGAQPSDVARLARERRALEAAGSPHAPEVYGHGVVRGRPYLVLEAIRARTLAVLMTRKETPLARAEVRARAVALLTALESIHARGVVHGDLKPENILFEESGRARLIDFGLARCVGAAPPDAHDPELDEAGTAEYMSPEQCAGEAGADPRSDLYGVGVLLYELLEGAPPFWGAAADVREAQRSRRPAPLDKSGRVTPALDDLVRRCLAKDPARRPESAASLRALLVNVLQDVSQRPSAATPSMPTPATSSGTREKRTLGLLFFEARGGLAALAPLMQATGGQIVHADGARHVAAYGHDVGSNPARSALSAARRLLAAGVSTRIVVDVAQVSFQQRPDGVRRIFSALFDKRERYPARSDPEGATLSPAAVDVLSHLRVTPVPGRDDRFVIAPALVAASTHLPRAPLVGREEPLRTLTEAARTALTTGVPTLATVTGAPGMGRSHFARVFAERFAQRHHTWEVLRVRAREEVLGAVSELLPELLRRVLALPSDPPADGGRALFSTLLSPEIGDQVWAAAALQLGFVDAEHPDVRRLAAAPGALRLAAARAAGEALRRAARTRPLCLVLDDAHFADEATLDALAYATLREANARLFVCVLAPPAFTSGHATWDLRAGRALRIELGPLAPEAAEELARQHLLPVENVPQPVLAKLVERTEGVPHLLIELLRGLKREGLVRRSERGTGSYLATEVLDHLPELPIVQWSASREIDALPAPLVAHARLSTVLGPSFGGSELEALLQALEREGAAEVHALDAQVGLLRLVEAGVLVRQRAETFAFRHPLLRDTLYQLMSDAQRLRLHRAALRVYEALPLQREQRLPRLALHAARCGAKAIAARAYFELAESALAAHAYLEAEAAYGGALANLEDGDEERVIAAQRGRGAMRFRLGRHEDALKDLAEAHARAAQLGAPALEAELALDEATVLDWTQDFERSAALVRAAALRCTAPSPALRARLAAGEARVHHRRGEFAGCVALGSEAAAQAAELGDAAYETRVIALMLVAPDFANLGRLDDAERAFAAAIAEAEAHGDRLHLGGAYLNRALLWFARKEGARVFDDLARTTQIAREVGSALLEFYALCNRAEVEYALECYDDAVEHTEHSIELARRLWGDDDPELGTRALLLARIALARGDLTVAAERAAALTERAGTMPASDQLLLAMVTLGAANADEPIWEALFARTRGVELQPFEDVELLESRALAAHRHGRHERSRALFAEALARSAARPSLLDERVARTYARLYGEP